MCNSTAVAHCPGDCRRNEILSTQILVLEYLNKLRLKRAIKIKNRYNTGSWAAVEHSPLGGSCTTVNRH